MFEHYRKWICLSAISGVLAGIAASLFLIILKFCTDYRQDHQIIIWGLPIIGFLIGYVYHRYGQDSHRGNNLVIDEIHNPKKTLPLRMAPLVLFGTALTHLFGGSAGREGTAVQMGATLSDSLSRFFKVSVGERKILLVCGAGAGFGAAIGAPWAGVVFGMEMISVGRIQPFAVVECFIASFVAYGVTFLLRAPHTHYFTLTTLDLNLKTFMVVILSAFLFGSVARIFIRLTHAVEGVMQKYIQYAPLKPLIGGLVLVGLYYWEGSYRYTGLGLPIIQDAFLHPAQILDAVNKMGFTAVTIGSGFKGGEFIPLVFVGSTLGSAISLIASVSIPLMAGVGFASVFAGASNTPLACTIMAIELFGWPVAPYAILGCYISYYSSGQKSIYASQRMKNKFSLKG